jgi:hypothetical protein
VLKIEEATVVGIGVWGPFDDGRTVPYVTLSDGEGDTYRASLGRDVTPPERMARGVASVQFHINDKGKPAWRLVAFEPAAAERKAAA